MFGNQKLNGSKVPAFWRSNSGFDEYEMLTLDTVIADEWLDWVPDNDFVPE